ncbi:tetratricopeptide repeat protein [Clostridiaceae bacterium M8S5]|nr:tetratricopeptide repeat protein [Clostridiaceae bacterium M8S5]
MYKRGMVSFIIMICLLSISLIGCNKSVQSDNVASENTDKAKLSYQKAVELHQKGYNDEAIKAYDKAIQLNKNYAEAYVGKGALLSDLGKPEDAIDLYDKAIFANPTYANAYYEKGRDLYVMQDYNKAIEALDIAIKLNSNYSDAFFCKGVIYKELKQYDNALQAFNKVIELDERNTLAYINKTRVLQESKKYQEGIQTLDTAIELVTNDDSLYFEKARIYTLMKNFDYAIKSLAKSIELNSNNAKYAKIDEILSSLELIEEFQLLLSDVSKDNTWSFNLDDLYLNDKQVLNSSYEDIIKHFGQPIKVDSYKLRMAGTDDYNYFLNVKYESMELELFFYDKQLDEPNSKDSIKRFDVIGQNMELACGLKVGMTVDEVINKFGTREIYKLNSTTTTGHEVSAINNILTRSKPKKYYSQYNEAMYIDMDCENVKSEDVSKYMGLVLLIKDNMVDRIVLGYPNLP